MEIANPWLLRMERPSTLVDSLQTLFSTVRSTIQFLESSSDFVLDTFSNLTALNVSPATYNFTEQGIAWPGESKKYASVPDYPFDQIVPPPNWFLRYPEGYSNTTPPPDLRADEHFQNWMRTAGLPTFSKLWGRNDSDTLKQGTYLLTVDLSRRVLMMTRGIANKLLD